MKILKQKSEPLQITSGYGECMVLCPGGRASNHVLLLGMPRYQGIIAEEIETTDRATCIRGSSPVHITETQKLKLGMAWKEQTARAL